MLEPFLCAAALTRAVTPALAADKRDKASADETVRVTQTIARIGCKPGPESGFGIGRGDLYQVDDTQCEIGQHDSKRNADFVITSLALD